jgi:hypothetical protein
MGSGVLDSDFGSAAAFGPLASASGAALLL